jgi:hypothetical protein
VALKIGGRLAAIATVTTLPDMLPTSADRPLVLLLGSCFCAAEDKGGRAGRRFAQLADGLRPDIKMLCGDQVYLDSPYYKFLLPHTKNGLARIFLENYADTWGQSGVAQGFQLLLSSGANAFTSDDHEYWNNAPFRSFATNTFTAGGRKDWMELARGLYTTFQTPSALASRMLSVGQLSFFIADTRIDRSDDRTSFLPTSDMTGLEGWLRGLRFPGILIVGQPIFEEPTNWTGRLTDWNLPDFEQYKPLCRALANAPQPVVVLTGDIHYGRVARARWPAGGDLVEIVASPLSLVTGAKRSSWRSAPGRFPATAIEGVPQTTVTTIATWQRSADHFLTLELWQEGERLRVRVRSWETLSDGSAPTGPVFDDFVQRRV